MEKYCSKYFKNYYQLGHLHSHSFTLLSTEPVATTRYFALDARQLTK